MQSRDGAPLSFMIMVRDISQRKKKEARQIHADRISTLGEMAAGIAHEINQPLNTISMVLDNIIFETTRTEVIDAGFLKKKSDKIFENITRIRDIIDHVRAFSRSHDDYVLTAFNVNSSIVNASSMITEQFKHQGISLNLHLEQQIPPLVGNTYKFEQVILNLLAKERVDYTIFWRRLSHCNRANNFESVRELFLDGSAIKAWLLRYSERLAHIPRAFSADLMLKTNPKFVLRNHLGEQAIQAARQKDFSQVATLLKLLESPFEEHPGFDAYADFPPDWASGIEISCSS